MSQYQSFYNCTCIILILYYEDYSFWSDSTHLATFEFGPGVSHQFSITVDGLVFADEEGPNQARGQVPLGVHGALVQPGQTLRVPLQGAVLGRQPPQVAKRTIGGHRHGA